MQETTVVETAEPTEEELIARFPVYDPTNDPRLIRYVAAMTKAYNREAKRRAGRILKRRGKGYTK